MDCRGPVIRGQAAAMSINWPPGETSARVVYWLKWLGATGWRQPKHEKRD